MHGENSVLAFLELARPGFAERGRSVRRRALFDVGGGNRIVVNIQARLNFWMGWIVNRAGHGRLRAT